MPDPLELLDKAADHLTAAADARNRSAKAANINLAKSYYRLYEQAVRTRDDGTPLPEPDPSLRRRQHNS